MKVVTRFLFGYTYNKLLKTNGIKIVDDIIIIDRK